MIVQAVLELCTHCKYQHMCIELLFHMVFSLCCLEVRFIQYCQKKSDQLIIATRSSYDNLSEALVQLDSEDIDAYGLVESEGSDWDHSQIGSYSSEFKLEIKSLKSQRKKLVNLALETDQLVDY